MFQFIITWFLFREGFYFMLFFLGSWRRRPRPLTGNTGELNQDMDTQAFLWLFTTFFWVWGFGYPPIVPLWNKKLPWNESRQSIAVTELTTSVVVKPVWRPCRRGSEGLSQLWNPFTFLLLLCYEAFFFFNCLFVLFSCGSTEVGSLLVSLCRCLCFVLSNIPLCLHVTLFCARTTHTKPRLKMRQFKDFLSFC